MLLKEQEITLNDKHYPAQRRKGGPSDHDAADDRTANSKRCKRNPAAPAGLQQTPETELRDWSVNVNRIPYHTSPMGEVCVDTINLLVGIFNFARHVRLSVS